MIKKKQKKTQQHITPINIGYEVMCFVGELVKVFSPETKCKCMFVL